MTVDADGRFRCVLSLADPGVANWLDPIGLPQGQCLYRWYDGNPFALPETKVVKLAELRDHLPAEAFAVSPERRAASTRARSRASLRRWHY